MAKNEFKNLNRLELVEIIYRLQEKEDELNEQIETLEQENSELRDELERRTEILNRRQLINKEAGSIAQEILAMSGIFEKAQKVADRYVLEIKRLKELAEEEVAEAKAEKMSKNTRSKSIASKTAKAKSSSVALSHEEAFAQRLAASLIRDKEHRKTEEP